MNRYIALALCLTFVLVGTGLSDASAQRNQDADKPALLMPFDDGLYGCEGAVNPFAAIGNCKLVDDPARDGKVLEMAGHDAHADGKSRLVWEKSAIVIDGRNVPEAAGTVGFSVRFGGKRNWTDGKRTWLATLVPRVRTHFGEKAIDATGLAVWKDKNNDLVLCEYQFSTGRLGQDFNKGLDLAEPDRIVCRIPAGHLKQDDWARVRFGWDHKASAVWLALDDRVVTGEVAFGKAPVHALMIGTPPKIGWVDQAGLDGRVDDIVITARTPGGDKLAAFEMPAKRPRMATPPNRRREAVHLKGEQPGEQMEALLRSHYELTLDLQQVGGWPFSAAWPSRMYFLSTKVVMPYSRTHFNGSKAQNSAQGALRLLSGYLCLGDKNYLSGAERTAETLLALQGEDGGWPYNAEWFPERKEFVAYRPDIAPLEDHVQSHPTLLMMLLHELTGKPRYKAAAEKGVAFILMVQNPNGSWSHHWNRKIKAGQTARGHVYGGEINDFTTSDQMKVMLLAYRRTGEVKYLASWLRAVDWLADAFIDGKAKGWAQQYDRHNTPVQARHFEPAAIGMSEGTHSAPRGLMFAYKVTGEARYLAPVKTWYEWMMDNRVFLDEQKSKWGWYTYYDIETGEPFSYARRERVKPDLRSVRDGGFTAVLREVERIDRPGRPYLPNEAGARKLLEAAEGAVAIEGDDVYNRLRPIPLVEMFDWEAGSWTFSEDSPTGKKVNPATIRSDLICWSVFLRRQIKGQIPWDHRMATLDRVQWGNPVYKLISPAEYAKPISKAEIDKARKYIEENPIVPTVEGLKAAR